MAILELTDEEGASYLINKFGIPVIEDKYKVFSPITGGYILQLRYPLGHPCHLIRYHNSMFNENIVANSKEAEIFSELLPAVTMALAKQVIEPEIKCLIVKVNPQEKE